MRLSFVSVLAVSGAVSAATLPTRDLAPKLPLDTFKSTAFQGLPLDGLLALPNNTSPPAPKQQANTFAAAATCANPRVRVEWDSMSAGDRNSFISAVKCLQGRPRTGKYSQSQSKYEDFVALHQAWMSNIHNNRKFLIWHRYYLWAFEDTLRTECGWSGPLPWFDERRYAGRFSQSSVFSGDYFGAIAIGGNCVTNGKFANLALNVGPGSSNTRHCLARNGDASQTKNTNDAMVQACNSRTDYADMALCAEQGAHAWGHNGIGAVMMDVAAAPGDPVFWLHHAFIDRNYRVWQNQDSARVGYVDGTDAKGNQLTLDTTLDLNGLRPTVKIRDVINTLDGKLCYKYDY